MILLLRIFILPEFVVHRIKDEYNANQHHRHAAMTPNERYTAPAARVTRRTAVTPQHHDSHHSVHPTKEQTRAGVVAKLAPTHAHEHLSASKDSVGGVYATVFIPRPLGRKRQTHTGADRCIARRVTLNAGIRVSSYRVTKAEIQRTAQPTTRLALQGSPCSLANAYAYALRV